MAVFQPALPPKAVVKEIKKPKVSVVRVEVKVRRGLTTVRALPPNAVVMEVKGC